MPSYFHCFIFSVWKGELPYRKNIKMEIRWHNNLLSGRVIIPHDTVHLNHALNLATWRNQTMKSIHNWKRSPFIRLERGRIRAFSHDFGPDGSPSPARVLHTPSWSCLLGFLNIDYRDEVDSIFDRYFLTSARQVLGSISIPLWCPVFAPLRVRGQG